MKIILIGFMGSGKTSVAKALSQILKVPILEMDEWVYQKTNTQTMHEVFEKGGELLLRETEIAIAKETIFAKNIVVSTGAGIVMNAINFDYLKQHKAKTYFLNAPFQILAERLANDDTRPLFKDSHQARSLYDLRLPLYLRHADIVVDVEKKFVQEIAEEIAAGCS